MATFLSLICFSLCRAQTTFIVDNFSKDFYGKVFIKNTKEVFSPGWVAIFTKKTNKKIIEVFSIELTYTLHEGKILANIQELPYGEQSQIIYDDFQF